MVAGKLCVSVIEARNVTAADTTSDLSFYVKLRLGHSEAKTDVSYNDAEPKFLKDVRMSVPVPETDVLRIELLQVGPRGDLVVGKDDLRVLSVVNKGTVVHWFGLKTIDGDVGAELCLVLRYLSAAANRPMSPSYAIATREAKERAVQSQAQTIKPIPAKSAFTDEAPALARQPSANRRALPLTAATPEPASAATGSGAAAPEALPLAPSSPKAPPSPQRRVSDMGSVLSLSLGAQDGTAQPGSRPKKHKSKRKHVSSGIPLPAAIVGGMMAGALLYLLRRRPAFYDVNDVDTLCSIGSCFNKQCFERYKQKCKT
mmetsp:Transcript_20181/g.43973  ORF Transcript_20181/g.43973 Transcript_20181/m.43973 type:complete len:315 (+) Transcript_20181:300-1244(+)|eukprot:CAMPEP_0202898380 /NCGR_PEP_ID=MMETSP1392-20130828/6918_1 /ASSEMBLY_ACC=CAM_ASM_000868 /TAXON_ID=225041 /ORGANISM="Chlamydomonas chlamydogama, Strain SAG 11-48b" /LENGTH=314 /DNA_ID=CAMNT_0049584291 /DNA_START=298 /DNA_END=1242 /DNA_ORIENTATION=-